MKIKPPHASSPTSRAVPHTCHVLLITSKQGKPCLVQAAPCLPSCRCSNANSKLTTQADRFSSVQLSSAAAVLQHLPARLVCNNLVAST
jgi:hypothetical protein